MTTWAQFQSEAPELAKIVRERFEAAETHIMATLRKDGSPRISGTEVNFQGADLSFGSMLNAVKAIDLLRDGRCAIHAHPSANGDATVSGIAEEVTGEARNAYVTGSEPSGDFHAFRLELREAVFTVPEGRRRTGYPSMAARPGHPGHAPQVTLPGVVTTDAARGHAGAPGPAHDGAT